jgi:hypothetical protein
MLESMSAANRGEFYRSAANRCEFYRGCGPIGGSPTCWRAGVRPIGVSFTWMRAKRDETYMLESRIAANRGEFYRGAGQKGRVLHVREQEYGQ